MSIAVADSNVISLRRGEPLQETACGVDVFDVAGLADDRAQVADDLALALGRHRCHRTDLVREHVEVRDGHGWGSRQQLGQRTRGRQRLEVTRETQRLVRVALGVVDDLALAMRCGANANDTSFTFTGRIARPSALAYSSSERQAFDATEAGLTVHTNTSHERMWSRIWSHHSCPPRSRSSIQTSRPSSSRSLHNAATMSRSWRAYDTKTVMTSPTAPRSRPCGCSQDRIVVPGVKGERS